jgi:holo-[acyl-carrier protein] synthase
MPIISNGFDLVEVERVRKALDRFGERFLKRCFTRGEIQFCSTRRDPVPGFAVRYAAKEATSKALGAGIARGVGWKDIEISRKRGEAPCIILHGRAAERFKHLDGAGIHVSLTHEKKLAGAIVLIESG